MFVSKVNQYFLTGCCCQSPPASLSPSNIFSPFIESHPCLIVTGGFSNQELDLSLSTKYLRPKMNPIKSSSSITNLICIACVISLSRKDFESKIESTLQLIILLFLSLFVNSHSETFQQNIMISKIEFFRIVLTISWQMRRQLAEGDIVLSRVREKLITISK